MSIASYKRKCQAYGSLLDFNGQVFEVNKTVKNDIDMIYQRILSGKVDTPTGKII